MVDVITGKPELHRATTDTPENRRCFKHPDYVCSCQWQDENSRRIRLRLLRRQIGISQLDSQDAKAYANRKSDLCEGGEPEERTFEDVVQDIRRSVRRTWRRIF